MTIGPERRLSRKGRAEELKRCSDTDRRWNKNDEARSSIIIIIFLPSGVKIPRVKSKVKSKRKAEVVTPRR